jgi:hypothetical protein
MDEFTIKSINRKVPHIPGIEGTSIVITFVHQFTQYHPLPWGQSFPPGGNKKGGKNRTELKIMSIQKVFYGRSQRRVYLYLYNERSPNNKYEKYKMLSGGYLRVINTFLAIQLQWTNLFS